MTDPITTVGSKSLMSTKYFALRKDTALLRTGRTTDLYVIDMKEACSVVAVDDEENVVLFRQFRYPMKEYLLEIPGGIKSANETPEDCAKRELEEEAGFSASRFTPLILGYYQLCSIANPVMNIYLARGLRRIESRREDTEIIRDISLIPLDLAYRMVMQGEIKTAFSMLGILLAYSEIRLPSILGHLS
jgi:ADP-ribose diphosphatase